MFQGIPCNNTYFKPKNNGKDKIFLCYKSVKFVLYLITLTKSITLCGN